MSREMINALRKCAIEHENDNTFTGQIVVSSLCRDVANYLENEGWHYPSKGEVPKNNKIYILADRSGEEDYCVMYYEHRKDEDVWGGKFTPPYMWQYIIPPQEEV